MVRQLREELAWLVAPPMSDELVEHRPTRAVERGREENGCVGRCYPRQLMQREIIVVDVLDNVERTHQVKNVSGKRER